MAAHPAVTANLSKTSKELLKEWKQDKKCPMVVKVKITKEIMRREALGDRQALAAQVRKTQAMEGTTLVLEHPTTSDLLSWEDDGGSVKDQYDADTDMHVNSDWTAPKVYETPFAAKVGKIASAISRNSDRRLRRYQVVGAEFILQQWARRPGVMEGDDMGLGKTVTSMVALMADAHGVDDYTVIFLTKKGLVESTAKELRQWVNCTGKNVADAEPWMILPVLNETGVKKDFVKMTVDMAWNVAAKSTHKMIVTNYESLNSFSWLMDMPWTVMVVDEAHKLKGGAQARQTKVWLNAKKLSKQVKRYLFMSGTFINNSPADLWAQLNIFNEEVFDSLPQFMKLFTTSVDGKLQVDPDQLVKILTPMMIRREMQDVKDDMPGISWVDVECDYTPSQREQQDALAKELFLWLDSQKEDTVSVNNMLEKMVHLRMLDCYPGKFIKNVKLFDQWTGEPLLDAFGKQQTKPTEISWEGNGKLTAMLEHMDDLVVFNGEQIVVASDFNPPLEYIKDYYTKLGVTCEIIDGDANNKGKTPGIVERFQQGTLQVVLINKASGAEGLNLQKCDQWPGGAKYMFFVQRWWNPRRDDQMAARIYRINSTSPVTCYRYKARNSIDTLLDMINDEKDYWHHAITNNSSFKITKKDALRALGLELEDK